MKQLSENMKHWNRNIYGHIGTCKRILFLICFRRMFTFWVRQLQMKRLSFLFLIWPPLKALGSDSLHALSFLSQWEHIGSLVCGGIKNIFKGEIIDPSLNNTLVVLKQKVHAPENFSQFRPISLCSVLYKLVIKAIANWF